MVNSPARGCLEPEVIAAYVDHGLSLTERLRVDTHLASCPRCVALLAGVARTTAELSTQMPDTDMTMEAPPSVRRRVWVGALGAAAAVIVIVLAPSLARSWVDDGTGLVSLVDSVGEHRSVLGRLTGGFPHAPLDGPSAGGQDGQAAGTDRVLLTAGRIRESFGERTTPSQLHALGVAQLLAGRHDDAALSLLAAAREQPANARYLNDVATLQLERARLGLRPDDLPRALAAADRARRLDPSLHEAWFNHALAMNALSLRDQARASWMEYLRRDRSSAWASEARAHLEALNQPTPAQAWASLEGRLHQALDAATADHAVRTHTTEARHFIEDTLLPQWASAVGDGGDGAAELQQLRLMADAMLRVAGDALYRDVVGSIDRAGTEGATAVRQLASAHRAYADAARLFVQDRFAEAGPALATAQKALAALKSPFAHRVAVDLAGTILVRGDYEGTLAAIRDAKGSASALGYAYVAARATWFEGLIAFAQGRLSDTQFLYEELLAAFERMGDAEQTALAHNLLASYFYYLGDKPSEWKHREQALKGLAVSRSQRFRTQIVNTVALSLRQDNPEGALTLYNEALTHARAGRTVLVIEVLAQRATTLAMLGRWSEAAVDVAEARRELASIREPRLQQLYELLILAPEGELQRQRDASQAVATAARALDLIAARNNPSDRIRVPVFQLQLAKANVVWGRTHAAKVALANGIRAFDEERASMPDEGRLSALDQSWQLFEVAVQIAIKEKDFAKAFEMSERARTRTLAEARRAAAPRSLADAQASLADDEAIVALNQFNDELAVWVIRKHTLQVQVRAVRRVDAARLIARQHHEMWTKATQPNASQELFDQIIRPVFDGLRDVGRLVVVPDHTYQDAAFAGFWDASHRRYLVETVSIALSPTVDGYLSAKQSPIEASARDPLILGGPDREADEVARAVAAAYPTASLLTGASATRTRFFGEASAHPVIHISARTANSLLNPLLSRLLLSDDPGRRHSGAILGSEIAARAMPRTKLIVIDEIGTIAPNRGEGTLSMARAFMTAGVPAVIGTLPGADETATRDLMIAFHRELSKGMSAEQALHTVQRSAIQQNGRRLGAWSALVMYGSDR